LGSSAEYVGMTEGVGAQLAEAAIGFIELLDGVDVERDGDEVPDGEELSADELTAIRASQNDPATSPADAEAN
jgi:hypothetical protein